MISMVKKGEFTGEKISSLPKKPGVVWLVSCPDKLFQSTSARDCEECPLCHGFIESNGKVSSICGHPISRKITEVKV